VFLLSVVDGLTEMLSVSVYYLQFFLTIHDPRDSVRISSMLNELSFINRLQCV